MESEELVLIELHVDTNALKRQIDYLKTLHLLSPEPVLQEIVSKLEFMHEAGKIKLDKNIEENRQYEIARHAQEARYAEDQIVQRQMMENRKAFSNPMYTSGTATCSTGTKSSDVAFTKNLLKGAFDPPF